MGWLRRAVVVAVLSGAGSAQAESVDWTVDPVSIPWETLSMVPDQHREPARTHDQVHERMQAIQERLRAGDLGPNEHAQALVEMADLFRDEARIVISEDFHADPRIPLKVSPAWLQLELSLKWYRQAHDKHGATVDPDGRLALLRAVTNSRLGQDSNSLLSYAEVIRTYRRSPYADVAKLAVGDHHFRRGDTVRAAKAYRLVRNHRIRELAAYARFRLAHLEALEGDSDKAVGALAQLAEPMQGSLLEMMIADGARAAIGYHLAASAPIEDLVAWQAEACLDRGERCPDETREAAVTGYTAVGADNDAAWLGEMDRELARHVGVQRRIELAAHRHTDADTLGALGAVLEVCPVDDAECRVDVTGALADFYEEADRSEGAWVIDFQQLPKFKSRPDLDWELAKVAKERTEAHEALAALESKCGEDDACRETSRRHLLRAMELQWRGHDARWLRWVGMPPVVPGVPHEMMVATVRDRATAEDAVARMCGGSGCEPGTLDVLAAYYGDIGLEADARWLSALASLPSTGRADVDAIVASVSRDDLDARPALAVVSERCASDGCVAAALAGLERHFVAALNPRALLLLAPLMDYADDPMLLGALVHVIGNDLDAADAVDHLESRCAPDDVACSSTGRAALTGWYRHFGDLVTSREIAGMPVIAGRPQLSAALRDVVRDDPDPQDALERLQSACDESDADCPWAAANALSEHYERAGRPEDATRVRIRR